MENLNINIRIPVAAVKAVMAKKHKQKAPRRRPHMPVRHAGYVKVRVEEMDYLLSLMNIYGPEVKAKMDRRYGPEE